MRRYMHRLHSPFTGSLRQPGFDMAAVAEAANTGDPTAPMKRQTSGSRRGWLTGARQLSLSQAVTGSMSTAAQRGA
jgi:hypothetical protein